MATAAVGKLWVGLDLKTGGYQKGLKRSVKMTSVAAKDMKSSFMDVFKGNLLANLVTKSFSSVVGIIKAQIGKIADQFEQLDVLAKLGRQLDISTESLAAWRQAADLAGTGASTLDSGLEKLSVNLGTAAMRGGPAADMLKEMGLNAKELAAGPLDTAFIQIADAVDGMDSAIDRAAATTALFGRAGPKIALMMEGGAKSLEEAVTSAREQGILMSEEQLAGIEAANDAVTKLRNTFSAIFAKIAGSLAPHIEVIANTLREAFSSAAGDTNTITSIVDTVANALVGMMSGLQMAAGAVVFVGAKLSKIVLWVVDKVADLIAAIPGTGGRFISEDAVKNAGAIIDRIGEVAGQQAEKGLNNVKRVISGEYQVLIDKTRKANEEAAARRKKDALEERKADVKEIGVPEPAAESAAARSTVTAGPAAALIAGSAETQAAINAAMFGEQDEADEQIVDNTARTADGIDDLAMQMKIYNKQQPAVVGFRR
jgi:hypothetical protein